MAKPHLKHASVYTGSCIILTTKHAKSIAIGPPFWSRLNASILEYVVDTDQLGTFSGEIDREDTALACARRKCEWALEKLGDKVDYALASEGSFGAHPFLPYLPCDEEILYFIDRKRGFHLHLSQLSEHTNYQTGQVQSWEALLAFAKACHFPSHGLIVRPTDRATKGPVFKGIQTETALEAAYEASRHYSAKGTVWVETDMRAQFNPTRMQVIGELATQLADRLSCVCPACDTPGWGKVGSEKGLPCRQCGHKTELTNYEIDGCVLCACRAIRGRSDGLTQADPGYCPVCNP
ncbi:DUF6671 family protein [Spirosoma aerolatum]|uniref:DUF6671 family protein n=1 Tax=Spirosoma aerolatum TaxID=1211326 RepID=UPI0009AE7098|nr:DUF6671 family protein [Spirosoma aerolatum]